MLTSVEIVGGKPLDPTTNFRERDWKKIDAVRDFSPDADKIEPAFRKISKTYYYDQFNKFLGENGTKKQFSASKSVIGEVLMEIEDSEDMIIKRTWLTASAVYAEDEFRLKPTGEIFYKDSYANMEGNVDAFSGKNEAIIYQRLNVLESVIRIQNKAEKLTR